MKLIVDLPYIEHINQRLPCRCAQSEGSRLVVPFEDLSAFGFVADVCIHTRMRSSTQSRKNCAERRLMRFLVVAVSTNQGAVEAKRNVSSTSAMARTKNQPGPFTVNFRRQLLRSLSEQSIGLCDLAVLNQLQSRHAVVRREFDFQR